MSVQCKPVLRFKHSLGFVLLVLAIGGCATDRTFFKWDKTSKVGATAPSPPAALTVKVVNSSQNTAASRVDTLVSTVSYLRTNVDEKTEGSDDGDDEAVAAGKAGIYDEVAKADSDDKVDSAKGDDNGKSGKTTDLVESLPSLATTELSVESCVQLALEAHPKIQAARARVAAATYRIAQARALADPTLNNNFYPIASNAQQVASGRMQNSISLYQQVPWPEKLKAKAAIAIREANMAQAEVETIEREITETVRLAYYELWYADQGIGIVRKNQSLVADLIRASEARYRAGGSQQDVLNAEVERELLKQQQLEFASQRAGAEADLASLLQQSQLLNVSVEPELQLDNLPTQLNELIATAEQCNPELRGLRFQIQRDIQKQRLANLQRYSDLTLGGAYDFMTTGAAISPVADGKDNISFGVGFTLPIYREKIRAGISEASAEITNSAKLRDAEQLSIAGRLRRLLAEIDSLAQQRTLYSTRIIPRAEQALKIATAEYTVGKMTFVQLIENYRELLMYQLQVKRIESSLASRLAQLQRTVGCRNIEFQ